MEYTLSILKPDTVRQGNIGVVLQRFEKAGLAIVACRMMHLSVLQAQEFYKEHAARPFYADLVSFMTSGPVLVQVLAGENAIVRNRDLMGATDPKKAAAGTIRADFAQSVDANAVHGSDSSSSAEREIAFFFAELDICKKR